MSSKATLNKRGGSSKTSKQLEQHLSSASAPNFFKIEDDYSKELTSERVLMEAGAKIAALRSSLASNSSNLKKNDLRDSLLINAIKLRRLNRYFNFRNNFARNHLAEARQKVEENYLSMQNLTNEITHLRKNIEICMEFQAGDSDIELVGIDEFNATASEEANGLELVEKTDPHQLHLARLKHELNERRSMLANLQELEGRKSALLSDIRGKEQRLGQIRSKINAIKKATLPLFDELSIKTRPFEMEAKAKKSAVCSSLFQLRPLYTNEEFCREIFGTHSIELGCDALVRITDEVGRPSNGMNGAEEISETDKRDEATEREMMPSTATKNFFEFEDAIAEEGRVEQKQRKSAHHTDKMRTLLTMCCNGQSQQIQSSLPDELISSALFLKRLNRHSNFQIMAIRAKLSKMRDCVEKRTGELRNVCAGVAFTKKCVELCLDFQSATDIDLIPVEQFFAETNLLSLPKIIRDDAHQLQMARLKHELWTRKNLVDNVKEMEQKKKCALQAIDTAEKALGRVSTRENALKKTAKPLLDIVGLKSVALSVHNREIPFRPVPVSAETFCEIFGDTEGAMAGDSGSTEEEEDELMELGEDEQLF